MTERFLSITRLQLTSYWKIPTFLISSSGIMDQAKQTQGFISGKTVIDRERVFWTVTLWDDMNSMRQFMGSGAHLAAMPKLRSMCSHATVTHSLWAEKHLPSIDQCLAMLKANAKFSALDNPSKEHLEKRFPDKVRPFAERVIG